MTLKQEIEKLKYDKRVMEWHIRHGKLSADDAKKHIDALPDCSGNVARMEIDPQAATADQHH